VQLKHEQWQARLLQAVSPMDVIKIPELKQGLAHPAPEVRMLGFKQLLRTVEFWGRLTKQLSHCFYERFFSWP
jgi:hypothetical protein